MRKLLFAAILAAVAQPCFAETPDIVSTYIDITYDQRGPNFIEWFAKQRTSPEGVAITKAVASYYGVPPEVVNISTEKFWKGQLQDTAAGDEHRGMLASPAGYQICSATKDGDASITGPSTLNVAVWRRPDFSGLAWYAVVPTPGALGAGGNWAHANFFVSFVKSDAATWDKYKAKCDPANTPQGGRYLVLECKGQNCNGPSWF
jgi:hypothetical protein